MFDKCSFINSVGEYAYDCDNRYDMLLRDDICDNAVEITTQYGKITVSGDTLVATNRGIWKRADTLCVGDCLRHYLMNSTVVTGITLIEDPVYMFKLVDCMNGYLAIEGLYVSADM